MISDQDLPGDELLASAATAERMYVIGGFMLILSGMVFGDLYAIFVLHPNIDAINAALAQATAAMGISDVETIKSQFAQLGGYFENAGTKKDAHVHILHVGYLALLLAFLQHKVGLSDGQKRFAAKVFLGASIILPVSIFLIHYVGLVFSPLKSIGWASITADLAGLALALVMLSQLWGIVKSSGTSKPHQKEVGLLSRPESRMLLTAGVLMVLVGFLLGALHAYVNVENNENRELSILTELVERASAGDAGASNELLTSYGMLQGERALTIAAHAHIIEFGILAMMLALIQPYIFLSVRLKTQLARLFIVGSIVLPIAVYSELWYGLLAGGVADVAGLFVIVSLFAMLAGVLRHTGVVDADRRETQ